MQNVTHYRTATIEGITLFYREAGPANGQVVVLLHGFPTSSHMFRNLIPTLADRYHVIAPDYPGFGQSAAPEHTQFSYTFAKYASLVDQLLQKLGATRYAMYVMDYGAPVGYRLALLHPERVTALIVQNGNAYDEGLGAFWDPDQGLLGGRIGGSSAGARLPRRPGDDQVPVYRRRERRLADRPRQLGARPGLCSTGPATATSSSISSTTMARTCRSTLNSRRSSANSSRPR